MLDKYVKYEYDEYDFIISFLVHLPHDGQYGIDLYARDPEYQTEKRTMSHCCKYIINYSKPPTVDAPVPASANSTSNNNHLYHDYSFDSAKSNGQPRMTSPRSNATFLRSERSISPRKSTVSSVLESVLCQQSIMKSRLTPSPLFAAGSGDGSPCVCCFCRVGEAASRFSSWEIPLRSSFFARCDLQ